MGRTFAHGILGLEPVPSHIDTSVFVHPRQRQDEEILERITKIISLIQRCMKERRMGLEDEDRRELRKIPQDDVYRLRLKEGVFTPEHSMTLIKCIMHSNFLEDYDYNPSSGLV